MDRKAYTKNCKQSMEKSWQEHCLDLAGDWYFSLDADGVILYCKKSATATDASLPEDLQGKNFRELFLDENKAKADTLLLLARQSKCRQNVVITELTKEAETEVLITVHQKEVGGVLVGYSVLLRRNEQCGAFDDYTRLDLLVRNFPGIVWLQDQNGIVTLCEGQTLQALGLFPADIIGKSSGQIIEQYHLEFFDQYGISDAADTHCVFQVQDRKMKCTKNVLHDRRGKVVRQLGTAQDITDMTRMQERLEKAIEEVESANQAKSEFLSRMSHEIRTPMNAIIGMNSVARKTDDLDKIRYCLDKIDNASQQLLDLINDILDMSKIESGKFEIVENEFNFEKMLQNVCNLVTIKMEEKEQIFNIDFDDLFFSNLICDELRLTQVLINLLSNAIKFTDNGGSITLRIRHWPQDDERSRLYVAVQDTGIGITAEQMKSLFESFDQADGSITRKYGGTGLGLVISKKIVNLMGGEIWVESEPDVGSTFSFEVDFRWGSEIRWDYGEQKLDAETLRVLTVDDQEEARAYFSNILTGYNLRNETAESGEQAIQMLQQALAEDDPFNLLFLDWQMPGLSGKDTAKLIRELVGDDVVIVAISVADWQDIEDEAEPFNITRFLCKPVLPSQLFNVVMNAMEYPIFTEGEETQEEKASYHWRGKRILLAEDIDINREIIQSILEDTQVAIENAVNGREAVDMYRAAPQAYDAILMDIQMPEMDGLQATRAIRSSGLSGCNTIPIIAMTANAFKEDVEQSIAAGMNEHVAKPLDVEELMEKLNFALGM